MPSWWRRELGTYDRRLMRCAPGTHEAAAALLARHLAPRDDLKVLDLASGTGAFLARLRDTGYRDLHAVELNVAGFPPLGDIVPQPVDLNGDFANSPLLPRDLDLITAIEIIEHLDSPRHFLRNVRSLLRDGGHLLLTTPNVAHWLGRTRFLLSGELRQFQRHDYDYQRHVSPVTDIQVRLIFEEIGLRLIEHRTAGTFFGPVKRAMFSPITALARFALGPLADGDVSIYLVQRIAPTTDSAGKDSFYFKTTGA